MRIDPLRVELTVPEQHVSLIKVGQQVRLTVDAYPGEEFAATVRFVSPVASRGSARAHGGGRRGRTPTDASSRASSRPRSFVSPTPRRRSSSRRRAVETIAGTSRVYVVKDNRIEERIVTLGEKVGDQVEITSGVAKGDVVAAEPRDGCPTVRQVNAR